jgi:hypothetical protein
VNQEKIKFLEWLKRRMHFKYGCAHDDSIIISLTQIIDFLRPKKYICDIDNSSLDKIISKYWIDFNLDRADDINLGFSEKDRVKLRNDIKNIVSDIINKNVPKDFTIKG